MQHLSIWYWVQQWPHPVSNKYELWWSDVDDYLFTGR